MYGKVLFAAGVGIGYLVGTQRGRQDYERLKAQASRVWLDPRVQKVARQAGELAEKNLPMGEKVGEAVSGTTEAARRNVGTAAPAS
jgi:hypothetical protein